MSIKSRTFIALVFMLFCSCYLQGYVFDPLPFNECLLPEDHALHKKLKNLFDDPHMFDSQKNLKKAGFQVFKKAHRGLMVAKHPSMNNYLFKKFVNDVDQEKQLKNYLRRINGARALSEFIQANELKDILVPRKWLYRLPKQFSDPKTKEPSYILIVDKMDICKGGKEPKGEVAKKYYNIDKNTLKELCMVVYNFRGLDSVLHNLPFTYDDKIAFIDTERWERDRSGFLRRVVPFLSKDRQEYVKSVYKELKEQERKK